MLFGQSVFQSVLTRLNEEHGEEEVEERETAFRIQGLGLSFVPASEESPATADGGTNAYLAFLPEPGEIPTEGVPSEPEDKASSIPAHLLRLTAEEIADELAITASDTEVTLAEKRRRFAKANHPDSVPAAFRDNANIRMKTANLLIDTAIKGLFWR